MDPLRLDCPIEPGKQSADRKTESSILNNRIILLYIHRVNGHKIEKKDSSMWKYLIGWVPMIPIAILNAFFRESFLSGRFSELHAHQISTATAVILFGIYIWWLTCRWRPGSARRAVAVGLMWLSLTVSFEFLFGHYVMGHPWRRLFGDYNILAGRVWIIIPLWLALAPYLFFRIRERNLTER